MVQETKQGTFGSLKAMKELDASVEMMIDAVAKNNAINSTIIICDDDFTIG